MRSTFREKVDRVDPGDTILSLAERLARYGGGGTNCAVPLQVANRNSIRAPSRHWLRHKL